MPAKRGSLLDFWQQAGFTYDRSNSSSGTEHFDRNQEIITPETLEDALDYLTMCEQDQATGTFIVTDQVTGQQYLMVMINGVFLRYR